MDNQKKKYLVLLFFITMFWYILNVLFSYSWTEDVSVLLNAFGLSDSTCSELFLALWMILIVLFTGTEPFLWSKIKCYETKKDYSFAGKKGFLSYGIIVFTYFFVLAIKFRALNNSFESIFRKNDLFIQLPCYWIVALSLVLFSCGLAYRAFIEETKLHTAVCCLIISFLVSPFFLIYTHSVEIFIFQFFLQFTTLIVFSLYPSIWIAVSYETVMMYISFVFK